MRDVDNYEVGDVEWADAVLSVGGERSIRVVCSSSCRWYIYFCIC